MASGVLRSFFGKTINVTATLNKGKCLLSSIRPPPLPCTASISQSSIRYSSFASSRFVERIEQYPEIEVLKNPPEWKYVERILRKPQVPQPQPKSEYPSGWQPQTNLNNPYYVARTKNHMVPVYLNRYYRGLRRITKLRKIQGDIWLLERELRECIESRIGKKIATRVNELSGQIWIKGDYVTIVNEFLLKKGL